MSLIVDGSLLEGGGQIIRNTITLCCLTGKEVEIVNVRKGRSKPGLRPQHLCGLQLVGRICNGELTGDKVESEAVTFKPQEVKSDEYVADTKTAGSISLLMQISVPCLCFGGKSSTLTLHGGTDAEMAPPVDYYTKVFLPTALRFGINVKCQLVRRGFYPKGKGEVHVEVNPTNKLNPITMKQFGEIKRIYGTAFVAGSLESKVTQKMASSAIDYISRTIGITPEIHTYRETDKKAFATGCGIIIIAETSTGCLLAASSVGKKGKPAEEIGLEAATILCEDISFKACADRHLQDQLIIFMALADGISELKVGPVTLHTRTAIYISETLTKAKFTVECIGGDVNQNIITCQGIGYESNLNK